MTNYREILRLSSLQYSQRTIESMAHCSRHTVRDVLQAAKEQGISWPLSDDVANADLEQLLFPNRHKASSQYAEPDYPYIHRELARSGVTLTLLWEEYCAKCQEAGKRPYMSTQFGERYRRWARITKATMRIQHKPGDAMQVDWAGDTIPIQDPVTGEQSAAYLFVAVLPCSYYTYAEACDDMKTENWLNCHVHAFDFFGGVARLLIPDNCKTATLSNTRYDVILNRSYQELAEHYGTAIVPARVRKPKDKSPAEAPVRFAETWIVAALRDRKFFSLRELNEAVAEKLDELNSRPFKQMAGCRRSAYLEEEKPYMLPLPVSAFEPAVWSVAKVANDYLVTDGRNKYSVPYNLIGERVDIRVTKTTVEVFYHGSRVASHRRLQTRQRDPLAKREHMPPEHQKSHIDDFLSHNRINHSEEDFVLVKGNFEPIVSEALWETCNQIRSKRAAFVKGKDGRAHKFGVSFPQNKWTKILFCDCGMRFQIEGYDKTANGGKNMRLICARSKMFKKKDAARALNGIPCPAPYASEWKLELMAREVFRTVWKENAEDILGLLRMLDANLNTTGTPNDGNQLENKLSALNEELDDLVSQRASRSITMDDFLSRSTEINNEIINVEGLLQSSIQEQRPKARLDMHSIEAALSDDASFPDGKIEPGFLDRYANRIVKSNNRYIWMLQLVNVQQIMPIQSERQPIAMVTYKSGVPYDIEQEQTGKQDKESAGPDCATICRPQDFFLNMSRTKRKRKLVEWLESCQENQVNVLDEKIPLLSFAVDFVTAYEYQKARGIKIHPGLWKDMRVDIFLVKKEN